MGYIYKITNDVNNKVYIGLTTKTLQDRFKQHKYKAKEQQTNKDNKQHLYNAMNLYGEDKFHISLIEECDNNILPQREIYWIKQYDSYNNGYNSTLGGEGVHYYNYDIIYQFLLDNELTGEEIAKQVGCCNQTVYNVAHYYNINLKSKAAFQRWQNLPKNTSRQIYQYDKQNNFIQSFSSLSDAAKWIKEKNNCPSEIKSIKSFIRNCCNNKAHRNTAYGYIWRFKS